MAPLHKTYALAAAAILVSGCTSMLPRGSVNTPLPFASHEQARQALDKVVPFKTSLAELRGLGFDTDTGTNVTRIPYPDVLARLVPYSGVPLAQLDPGIQRCIDAGTRCQGWQFHLERLDHTREGGFWADFFNVSRVTHVKGWTFDALVVAADGVVLFRNAAGQPNVERVERSRNPLGPLQPAGEGAGALLVR